MAGGARGRRSATVSRVRQILVLRAQEILDLRASLAASMFRLDVVFVNRGYVGTIADVPVYTTDGFIRYVWSAGPALSLAHMRHRIQLLQPEKWPMRCDELAVLEDELQERIQDRWARLEALAAQNPQNP